LNLSITTVDTSFTVSDHSVFSNASGAAYQWVDCENAYAIIMGETSQSYTAMANGNYAVIITQGLCTDTSACIYLTPVGIASKTIEKIAIYPNPVSNELFIEMERNDEKLNFEIINATGQVVLKGSFVKKTSVQTSNFAAGVYILKLENGKTFELKKIIIK